MNRKSKRMTDAEKRDLAWGRYMDWLGKRDLEVTFVTKHAFMKGWESKKAAIKAERSARG